MSEMWQSVNLEGGKGDKKLSKWRPEATEQHFVGHPLKVSEICMLFHKFRHPKRVQNGAQIKVFLRFSGLPVQSGPTGLSKWILGGKKVCQGIVFCCVKLCSSIHFGKVVLNVGRQVPLPKGTLGEMGGGKK